MSTSHPPFTYGRTVTLIAVLLQRWRALLLEAVQQIVGAEQNAPAQANHARQLPPFDHCVHRAASGAEQVGRIVDREQQRFGIGGALSAVGNSRGLKPTRGMVGAARRRRQRPEGPARTTRGGDAERSTLRAARAVGC